MKENSKEKIPLEKIIERYFNVYVEYRDLYLSQEPSREDIKKEFKDLVLNSSADEEKFKEKAKKIWIDNSIRHTDLRYYENKFLQAVDLYLLTTEEELDQKIVQEYILLKKQEHKPFFSVVNKEFKENTKTDIKNIPQQEFNNIFNAIKYQIENNL